MNPFKRLESGQILAGKYLVSKPKTAGGFGMTYSATRLADDAPVVVKALRRGPPPPG